MAWCPSCRRRWRPTSSPGWTPRCDGHATRRPRRWSRPLTGCSPTPTRARRLGVRANADTGEDAARARSLGAQGIGLCRTEHMFLGDRRALIERVILAGSAGGTRAAALEALLPLQRQDFVELLDAMDGLPVTIRLLDPPLHEFLPDRTELAVKVALAEAAGQAGRGRPAAARRRGAAARVEPDARPARRPARPAHARPVRAAGPRHHRGRHRAHQGRQEPAGRDHGAAGRVRDGAAPGPRRGRDSSSSSSASRPASASTVPIGTMIELPARRAHRAPHRRRRRLLLLRHQRPHPDQVGLLPRRRRGRRVRHLPGEGRLHRLPVRDHRRRRHRPPGQDRRRGGPRHQTHPQARRLRRTRRRPRIHPLLPRRRPRLRLLLAVPRARRPARGRPRGRRRTTRPRRSDDPSTRHPRPARGRNPSWRNQ